MASRKSKRKKYRCRKRGGRSVVVPRGGRSVVVPRGGSILTDINRSIGRLVHTNPTARAIRNSAVQLSSLLTTGKLRRYG